MSAARAESAPARAPVAGALFVVAAPSGAGKSSLVDALLKREPHLKLSISYTTRPPRPGEGNGREYHFVDRATFDAMRTRGAFLECAEVYGNFYGTSKEWIDAARAVGDDVILEIDWQGARQVHALIPDAIRIFIQPPSIAALRDRLEKRAKDSADIIERRLAAAREDLSHAGEFDYVIINDNFDQALSDLQSIIKAARLRTARQLATWPAHSQ